MNPLGQGSPLNIIPCGAMWSYLYIKWDILYCQTSGNLLLTENILLTMDREPPSITRGYE